MNDFDYEVMQRKRIAGAARHRKCGSKSKKCYLPTDHMTPKQWRERCGSVKTYQLNEPVSWSTFKSMPQDIQREYLNNLQKRFLPTATDLSRVFGVTASTITAYLGDQLGIKFSPGKRMPKAYVSEFNQFLDGRPFAAPTPSDSTISGDSEVIADYLTGRKHGHHDLGGVLELRDKPNGMQMSEFSLVFDGEFNIETIHNSIASMIPKGSNVRIEIKCAITPELRIANEQGVA